MQKHAARRLHYDFRLEVGGVLKSWAVPKGPSLVAGRRRLAVQTADHAIEYASFEGVIPKGQYGGGAVIVWDHGRWTPLCDVEQGLASGKLEFELRGEKLRGRWHLVRTGAARDDDGRWLLIKGRDEQARDADEPEVTQAQPHSVLSGRDIDGLAQLAAPVG